MVPTEPGKSQQFAELDKSWLIVFLEPEGPDEALVGLLLLSLP